MIKRHFITLHQFQHLNKCLKIFHSEVDIGLLDGFTVAVDRRTRGHIIKIVVSRCALEMRGFFHVRVIQRWNSLFEHTVTQPALSSFKRELDRELGDL